MVIGGIDYDVFDDKKKENRGKQQIYSERVTKQEE